MGVILMCSQFKKNSQILKYIITANSWKDLDPQPVNLKKQGKGKKKRKLHLKFGQVVTTPTAAIPSPVLNPHDQQEVHKAVLRLIFTKRWFMGDMV